MRPSFLQQAAQRIAFLQRVRGIRGVPTLGAASFLPTIVRVLEPGESLETLRSREV
jgi:hypothetical protein